MGSGDANSRSALIINLVAIVLKKDKKKPFIEATNGFFINTLAKPQVLIYQNYKPDTVEPDHFLKFTPHGL
jgi:hypothetical protein